MSALEAPVLGRMLRPFAASLHAEMLRALAALQCDSSEDEHFHELAEKNAEGRITPGELHELEAIVSANTLLSVLRAEARAALAASPDAKNRRALRP